MPVITSVWSKVVEEDGRFFSTAVVESTVEFVFKVNKQDNGIVLKGDARLNMPEGFVAVKDGLLKGISLSQPAPEVVLIKLELEHPADFRVEVLPGIPVRTIVSADRGFFEKLFGGKKIIIDPGHGGTDCGHRGPVSLLEKNVVVPIALNLEGLFRQTGAKTALTRRNDDNIPFRRRAYLAKKEKADLFLSIHTRFCKDCNSGGSVVFYNPFSRQGNILARLILAELSQVLKIAARGIGGSSELKMLGEMPAVSIEAVTISNWVEEGLLRSPTIHRKAAQGIFNGVKNYLVFGKGECE
jgi:N-acetylmuramoyl-L-alanine amidase